MWKDLTQARVKWNKEQPMNTARSVSRKGSTDKAACGIHVPAQTVANKTYLKSA